MQTKLEQQRVSIDELTRIIRNFRKDGSSRKTEKYLQSKRNELDAIWEQISKRHSEIEYNRDQPYFIEQTFDKCGEIYDEAITDIDCLLEALKESSTGTVTKKTAEAAEATLLQLQQEELYGIMTSINEINDNLYLSLCYGSIGAH